MSLSLSLLKLQLSARCQSKRRTLNNSPISLQVTILHPWVPPSLSMSSRLATIFYPRNLTCKGVRRNQSGQRRKALCLAASSARVKRRYLRRSRSMTLISSTVWSPRPSNKSKAKNHPWFRRLLLLHCAIACWSSVKPWERTQGSLLFEMHGTWITITARLKTKMNLLGWVTWPRTR